MADITPKMVKELRERTGAGMGTCKKALTETGGDMEAAIEYLRKKGAASAAKRADRETTEGRIFVQTSEDFKTGVLVEVDCETDFVAMNEHFVKFVDTVGNLALKGDYADFDSMKSVEVDGTSIEAHYNDILAKFSEKIEVATIKKIKTEGSVVSYLHSNNKIGVLLELTAPSLDGKGLELAKDITMQIAAMSPGFVNRDSVDQDTINKEMEIYKEQAANSGKNDEIAERIATGRLNKFYAENCLVEQQFVKDSKKTVTDVLKEIGDGTDVKDFVRISIG